MLLYLFLTELFNILISSFTKYECAHGPDKALLIAENFNHYGESAGNRVLIRSLIYLGVEEKLNCPSY